MSEKGRNLKQGDVCDVAKILSSESRDYLIRSNIAHQVQIESLRGKIVGICIGKLCQWSVYSNQIRNLVAVYNHLSLSGNFEVVFVAIQENWTNGDDENLFDDCFSKMPWLAIPYSDSETRMRFVSLFHLSFDYPYHCVIIDEKGLVLTTRANSFFWDYGAEWYPFTKERFKVIVKKDHEDLKKGTLESLLSSPSRNYVISNTKEELPISELEGKVVGLYLYKRNHPVAQQFTPKLVDIYHKLKDGGKNFEVVMVNLHLFIEDYDDDEELFEEDFKCMPWLALPFMDQNCRKLLRLFSPYYSYDHDGVLVILGPGGNILDTYGAMILWKYGIEAYPFTREKLMETEIARLKTHTLESVMTSLGINYVNTKLGATIQISDLVGKCVLLFVAKGGYSQSRKMLPKLLDWYGNARCSENSFEVIFFSYDEDMSSFINFDSKMPWIALPLDGGIDRSLEKMFKVYNFPWLIAFGRDGRFLTNYGEILLRKCGINECHVYNHLRKNVKIQIELELGIRESLLFYPMEVGLDIDDDEDNDSSSDMSLGIDRAFNEDDNEEEDDDEEEEEEEEEEEMEVDLCSHPAGSERTELFSSASLACFC